MVKFGHFQYPKMVIFSCYFAISFNEMSHFEIEILTRIFPQKAKSIRFPRKCNEFRNHPIEQNFPFYCRIQPNKCPFQGSLLDLIEAMPHLTLKKICYQRMLMACSTLLIYLDSPLKQQDLFQCYTSTLTSTHSFQRLIKIQKMILTKRKIF